MALILSLLALFKPATVYAGWPVDNAPPTCTIIYTPGSISPPLGSTINITVTADDSTTGGSRIALITLSSNPSLSSLPASSTASPLNYTWTTTPGSYIFSATAKDTLGNTNTSCLNSQTFTVGNYDPWIQVTGDVHSNTRINLPGGP